MSETVATTSGASDEHPVVPPDDLPAAAATAAPGRVPALLASVALLMLGVGLHGSLIGVRAADAGFGPAVTGAVMAAYFVGYLVGCVATPFLIVRVGHARSFAALTSTASASVLVHVVAEQPGLWTALRLLTGACLAGVFVVAESWLNGLSANAQRGRRLAAYMVVSLGGMGAGALLLNVAPPEQVELFVLASVLLSAAVVPVSLTTQAGPPFTTISPIAPRVLWRATPLGVAGALASGFVTGSLLGFGPVYGRIAGLSVGAISAFLAAAVLSGAATQIPVGRLSDRRDRRLAIAAAAALGTVAAIAAALAGDEPAVGTIVLLGAAVGGCTFPLYSLCLAHVNDYLEPHQVVGAGSAMVLLSGTGAVVGPGVGAVATAAGGPASFWLTIAGATGGLVLYTLYRLRRRGPAPDPVPYAAVSPTGTPVSAELPVVFLAEPTEGTLDLDGFRLAWTELGEGPAVCLLHDVASSRRVWDGIREAIAAGGRRALTPDLRGHGDSAHAGAVPLARHAVDAAALLDHLGTGPVHLVGDGLGAGIALHLASIRPDLVESVAVRRPVPSGQRWRERDIAPWQLRTAYATLGRWGAARLLTRDTKVIGREDPRQRLRDAAAADPDAVLEGLASARLRADQLDRVRAPVVVLIDPNDPERLQAAASRLAARIADARVVSIPPATRRDPTASAMSLVRALRRFWQAVEAGSGDPDGAGTAAVTRRRT